MYNTRKKSEAQVVLSAGCCVSKLMTRPNCVNGTEGRFTSPPALASKRTKVPEQ